MTLEQMRAELERLNALKAKADASADMILQRGIGSWEEIEGQNDLIYNDKLLALANAQAEEMARLEIASGFLSDIIRERDETIAKLVEALKPLARVADVCRNDPDMGLWSESANHRIPVRLLVAHAINARNTLKSIGAL